MGEGLEVLLWLAVMAAIGLRGAMQRRQADRRPDEDESDARSSLDLTAEQERVAERLRREERTATGRSSRERARSQTEARRAPRGVTSRRDPRREPERARKGLLERWSEMAEELEREARAQREAATRGDAGTDRTVVVPGRRVYPQVAAPDSVSSGPDIDRWEVAGTTLPERRRPGDLDRPPSPREKPVRASEIRPGRGVPAGEGVDPVRRPGLERLESYPPLARAVILADVLGPPPGLDGVSPAERRLDELV